MSKPKTLVNKATTDDRTPPSGYILQELAQKSQSISECEEIESLVLKKLSKNKPYVKKKALRIVKYICDNGSPQWKRAWQRHTDKLKECQQYRGPPDQVYGDSPYKEVRDAAKEAMSAVFAVTQLDNKEFRSRIKGLDGGQTSYSSSGSVKKATFGSGSTGVYSNPSRPRGPAPSSGRNRDIPNSGTGNTKYVPKSRDKPFEPLPSKGGYNPNKFGHKNPYSQGQLDNRTSRGKAKRKKRTAGGVWGDDDGDNNDDDEDDDNDDYQNDNESFPHNESSSNKPTFVGNGANGGARRRPRSDGRFERKWVDDITKGAGIGIKIPQSDLDKYVQQFENLSQDHVLEYLDEKLQSSENWKEQGKALTLIEGLLDGSSSSNVEEYFQSSPDSLQFLIEEGKASLKKKARNIMEIIGIEEEDEEANTTQVNNNQIQEQKEEIRQTTKASSAVNKPVQQPADNLLDIMNFDANVTNGNTTQDTNDNILAGLETEDANDMNTTDDMFSQLNVADSAPAAAQQSGSLLLPTNQTQNESQTQNQGSSLLLPTNDNNTNGNAQPNSGNSTSGPMEDLFSGLGGTQQDSNLNNLLSGGGQSNQQQQQSAQQGSGFSFVNGNNASTQQTQQAAQGSSFNFIANNANQNGNSNMNNNNNNTNNNNSSGFSFVQNQSNQQMSNNGSMNQLRGTTNQMMTGMNQVVGNMNQLQNMMNQAGGMNASNASSSGSNLFGMNQGMNNMNQGMNQMGSGMNMNQMNNMNNMNNMGGMNSMNSMNSMNQMGTGMNSMNTMNNMNMGGMNSMNSMGSGMNMNSMNMGMNMNNNMNMMGGATGMNNMNNVQNQQNPMNAMLNNNMSNFSGLTTSMNHQNPLNQMRRNDPFAAVINGQGRPMGGSSMTQAQPKKQTKDAFAEFGLSNVV